MLQKLFDLCGKVAVVTGASRGLGAARCGGEPVSQSVIAGRCPVLNLCDVLIENFTVCGPPDWRRIVFDVSLAVEVPDDRLMFVNAQSGRAVVTVVDESNMVMRHDKLCGHLITGKRDVAVCHFFPSRHKVGATS